MTRVLLVTNDFPPRRGGIQSYLEAFVGELNAAGGHELTVYAPQWKGAPEYDEHAGYRVVRHRGTLMVPEPTVANRMRALIAEHDIETVWFGAAAPLALLGPLARRAGASRVVASTHGHEVGWSMLPLARNALRRIGDDADVVTYVSGYTRGRFASAFGPQARLERLSPGVDIDRFTPDSVSRAQLRARYELGDRPVVLCLSRLVPRKGQDMLIRAFGQIRRRVPGAALVIVGGGPHRETLEALAQRAGVADDVLFTGGVPGDELPAHHAMADVFAMPCRTRGAGLDVEGLGIVFLEASASGVPVVAGRSGGAPETVRDGETGWVVDGTDVDAIATAVGDLLADPATAARMGAAGRDWVVQNWQWRTQGARLRGLLSGAQA
ncbi:MAG: GDP-mannose-dependent alpha-(1-6)-phosphatidylinositol monomannoside mannosyltransferase [Mycobacterium sp.]|jgi:phosphatidylinositol alpha-1,6-mannosyltransferase|nr:GDP-mannose-dependent alpha-(1-6)-phosphatidylinositol monomannoside mannosyltransferase [Mycobacterium sp.]